MINIYKNLKAEMNRYDISYAKLAECLDINPKTFGKKMSGQYCFRLDEAKKIREIISKKAGKEVALDYLFE